VPAPPVVRDVDIASVRDVSFPIALRGYDRDAVDAYMLEVNRIIAELQVGRSPQSAIRHALDQVSEETKGILERAHETADEITARSRAQAEGRIQRAEREAELVRRQADAYSEKIVVDTRLLWEERQRLIEDIRQLADDVLGTAEEALERVSMPELLTDPEPADTEAAPPTEEDGPPTSEVELDLLPGGAADEDEDEDDEETTRSD
jgi:DivIVA domain-containing protein